MMIAICAGSDAPEGSHSGEVLRCACQQSRREHFGAQGAPNQDRECAQNGPVTNVGTTCLTSEARF